MSLRTVVRKTLTYHEDDVFGTLLPSCPFIGENLYIFLVFEKFLFCSIFSFSWPMVVAIDLALLHLLPSSHVLRTPSDAVSTTVGTRVPKPT